MVVVTAEVVVVMKVAQVETVGLAVQVVAAMAMAAVVALVAVVEEGAVGMAKGRVKEMEAREEVGRVGMEAAVAMEVMVGVTDLVV